MSDNIKKLIVPFERSFASHDKSIYWSDKNILQPKDIFKGTHAKYYFDCNICGHELYTRPNDITNGHWCKYCLNSVLCENDQCIVCFDKSFAANIKSLFWSTKNKLTARQVSKYSHKKIWFDCIVCHHEFESAIGCVTQGSWCPYCNHSKLCKDNYCSGCFHNSFAGHPLVQYFSKKNKTSPRYITLSANKKYIFNCFKCKHEFISAIQAITRGQWCHFCSHDKLCTSKTCEMCFNNSFASSDYAKYWHKDNIVTAREVFISSNTEYLFTCEKGHTFKIQPNSIKFMGAFCSFCKNKTETKLYKLLSAIYPNVEREFKADFCKNIRHLPYDFLLKNDDIIVELDGEIHFEYVRRIKKNLEEIHERDVYKMKCANENGYSMIRIFQPDVWNKNYDITELITAIEKVKNDKIIQNVYISSGNHYDIFLS